MALFLNSRLYRCYTLMTFYPGVKIFTPFTPAVRNLPHPIYNVPIDVDMNFDPNPILWTLENTLIPIRGHQTVPLL